MEQSDRFGIPQRSDHILSQIWHAPYNNSLLGVDEQPVYEISNTWGVCIFTRAIMVNEHQIGSYSLDMIFSYPPILSKEWLKPALQLAIVQLHVTAWIFRQEYCIENIRLGVIHLLAAHGKRTTHIWQSNYAETITYSYLCLLLQALWKHIQELLSILIFPPQVYYTMYEMTSHVKFNVRMINNRKVNIHIILICCVSNSPINSIRNMEKIRHPVLMAYMRSLLYIFWHSYWWPLSR